MSVVGRAGTDMSGYCKTHFWWQASCTNEGLPRQSALNHMQKTPVSNCGSTVDNRATKLHKGMCRKEEQMKKQAYVKPRVVGSANVHPC